MSFKKKGVLEIKPILKDNNKEDKGLALQLVPEYVDKKSFQQGNHNPNYVFAGALYIPRDIIQIVNSNDTGPAQIYMGPIKDGGNVYNGDDQSVSIEDPDVRKYINRILRYFKYDPEEAMTTLREASFKIKNRARGIVKRTYSQNTVTKLQAWRAKVQHSEEESEDDLQSESRPIFVQNVPLIEAEDKGNCFYDDELEEQVDKQSFIQKTLSKIFPTKSTIKIDKSQRDISSSDSGEKRCSRNRKKSKTKKSKSMSHLINEGNKQVTGFLSSVTTDPEEKKEKSKNIKTLNLNKTISNKIKKLITMLKKICHKKSNIDNKAANNPTNFIYSDMYLNYQGSSVKKKSLKCEVYLSRKDELLLSYLTAPRIHHSGIYTVMLLSNENPQNLRSHNRRRTLKKMKKRLQRLDTLPYRSLDIDQFYNPCSIFDQMARNEDILRFNKMLPKQERVVCSNPCFETYNALDNRMSGRQSADVTRQSVDIIADTFVNVIDSPNDPKCKVEITGHGYKGKFNVGLDPIIDEVLYHSLQNLKETYENARCYYQTPRIEDRRRSRTLSHIAGNVRNYLKSKVSGRNSVRNSTTCKFSSENLIGRTPFLRAERGNYEEDSPQIIYENMNMKHQRYQPSRNKGCAPLAKFSRYFIDNEKNKRQPKYHRGNSVRKGNKKRHINSSESESFEERQFVRRTKGPMPPILESSDDSFVLRETSSTLDESIRLCNRGGSTANNVNKKGPLKTRNVHKQSYYPDLSYISEKDWKAATELLIRERENSILSADENGPVRYMSLNEYEDEKQSLLNNPTGNNKVVKMKETMTTTANGVTTVTQTEVIEAINKSSQYPIPSTSKDALVGRKEFNIFPMTHNETRREQSGGRLAKTSQGTQKHRNFEVTVPIKYEETIAPYKKRINHEVFPHKKKENSQKTGYPRRQCSKESGSHETVNEKHYFNSTQSLENLSLPDLKDSRGYNVFLTSNNTVHHCQDDSQKCIWIKGRCHCNTSAVNIYALSKEMSTMTPHSGITDFTEKRHRDPKRNVPILHKVHSDPINTCRTNPFLRNCPKDIDDGMNIKINAMTEIEPEQTPIRTRHNLHERIPFKKTEKHESQTPEEEILTGNGKAKIRVSLGSCDTTQRQQAFLELMEVLKRKIQSENQLMPNNATLRDNTTPLSNKKKIEEGTFEEMNKTATVAIMTPAHERPRDRMRFQPTTLKSFEITSTTRGKAVACHKPCFCNEKRKCIPRKGSPETIIPRQTRSSGSLLFNQKDVLKPEVKIKCVSISVQTDNSLGATTSAEIIPRKEKPKEPPSSKKPEVHKNVEKPRLVSITSQTDDLMEISSPRTSENRSSLLFGKKRTPSQDSRRSSTRSTRESRPRIKTGSLFSKSLTEKSSIQAARWRPSEIILIKNPPEPRNSNIPKTKDQEKRRKSSLPKKKKKDSLRKSSRRETVLTSRGSLFVRKSTVPSLYEKGRTRQSSVINQRLWIQNLNVPVKQADRRVADVKKEKTSGASALHKLKGVSNIYSYSRETGNCIVNSRSETMSNRRSNNTFSKMNRNYLSIPHNFKNNPLSRKENDENSIIYRFPKQSKEQKFIAAPIRNVSRNPGIIDSLSLVSYRNSSSFIKIIGDPKSVKENSSKLTSAPSTIHSRNSTDSIASVNVKYIKGSIISSDTLEKSSSSLLSYEESPSLIKCVENFKYLPSPSPATSYKSTNNKSFKGIVVSSKPQPVGKNITTVNETKRCSPIYPDNCDAISSQSFFETSEDIKIVTDRPQTRKEHSMNVPPSGTYLERKPSISSGSRSFKEQKSSSSGSSDSKTTVISLPIVNKEHLAMHLQSFITKSVLDSSGSNKSSKSSKRRESCIESTGVSERIKSYKSRFKTDLKSTSRSFMRRIQPSLINKIRNRQVVERVSSEDTVICDDSELISDRKQLDSYSEDPSTSQKSTERLKSDSNVSQVLVETFIDSRSRKRCINESVNKKTDGKPKKGKKYSISHDRNINSTLCINDAYVQTDIEMDSDEANCTTIGFDCNNVSLKKGNSKGTKCYKFRTMDETICSSTAWIINSSDSDLETSAAKHSSKRSKTSGKNQNKSKVKYLMVTSDLRQSSSDLLAKKSPKKTFVYKKRIFANKELKPRETSRKFMDSLLRKKRNASTDECTDN